MKRVFSSMLTVLALLVGVALAQSPHYKSKGGPACIDNGLTATCTGSLTGLGNFDVIVDLFTSGTGSTQCTNPGNGNVVPGQNPALNVSPSGILFIPASSIKNGNVSFTVSTTPPDNPTTQEAGCPNTNWTASFTDITFTSGSLVVSQIINGVKTAVITTPVF